MACEIIAKVAILIVATAGVAVRFERIVVDNGPREILHPDGGAIRLADQLASP